MDDFHVLVAERRQYPATCLYCGAAPDTDEHAVPRAMGGRLTAPILCAEHNSAASSADKVLSEWFAPWTHMLAVPKQGGGRGSSFTAPSVDGRPVKIEADGRAVEPSQVVNDDENGSVLRAESGGLEWISGLQARKEKSGPGPWMPVMQIPGGLPVVEFGFGLTSEVEPGLVKCALHFVAGFFPDVVVPDELRAVVLRNQAPEEDGRYVRPLAPGQPLFGDSWPPRHEVTAYRGADATYVTLMLYGLFNVVVRLPGVHVDGALRYVQHLDGSGPALEEVEPRSVPWHGTAMSAMEQRAYIEAFAERAARAERYCSLRQDHDRCVKAARAAHANMRRYNADFIDLFRAELDLYVWSSEKKDDAVAVTREMMNRGVDPWAVPMTDEQGGPGYGDAA